MSKHDPVVGWYSRLPPSDQMLLAVILRRRGHPQVASVLDGLQRRKPVHDRFQREKDVALDWAAAVLTGLWRSAAGVAPAMGEKVATDVRFVCERSRAVAAYCLWKLEGVVGAFGSDSGLNGLPPREVKQMLQLAQDACYRYDGFGNPQLDQQKHLEWRSLFPNGVPPPPKRQ